MRKKTYIQPTQRVIVLHQENMLMAGSNPKVQSLQSGEVDYGGSDKDVAEGEIIVR